MSYFKDIFRGIRSTAKGMSLTMKHAWAARHKRSAQGISEKNFFENPIGHVTMQYPHETPIVPDLGRYQLDCEIDDCIVCDKCAKVCPVDCIEIEAIKSPELIKYTSDGSPVRLHAATFDIDMAKCCFCGLCTTVCPTECLTMNDEYDFAVNEVDLLNFAYAKLTEKEAAEKRALYEAFVAEKEELKKVASPVKQAPTSRPIFKPKMKPAANVDDAEIKHDISPENKPRNEMPKRPFIPQKPKAIKEEGSPKKVFKPTLNPTKNLEVKPSAADIELENDLDTDSKELEIKKFIPHKPSLNTQKDTPKKVFRPTLNPSLKAAEKKSSEGDAMKKDAENNAEAKTAVKKVFIPQKPKSFKPTMKPKKEE